MPIMRQWNCDMYLIRKRLISLAAILAVSVGLASPGLGQTTQASNTRALLAGPKVPEAALGGKGSAFGRRRASGQSLSIREWMRAMKELSLTKEQRSEVQTIVDEFRQKSRDFQQAHGVEFRALRTSIREAREAGRDIMPDKLGRFRELQSRAPVLVEHQLRIWRTLTMEQQEMFRAGLARRHIERNPDRQKGVSGSDSLFVPGKLIDTRVKPKKVGGKKRDTFRHN